LLLCAAWSQTAYGQTLPPPKPTPTAPEATPADKDSSSIKAVAPPVEEAAGTEETATVEEPPRPGTWGIWMDAETLIWFMQHGPLPVPILASGNPLDPIPGALGQPGTHVLLGDHGIDYGTFPGMRLSMGKWWDGELTWGMEMSGFWFDSQSFHFSASADTRGNPPLYVPAFRSELGREGSFAISDPVKVLTGSVFVDSSSRFWGMEMNGCYKLEQSDQWDACLLAGFRYLDLAEDFRFAADLRDPLLDVNNNLVDLFATHNHFYGFQTGGRIIFREGRWFGEAVGKVALGFTRQTVDISGSSIESGKGVPHPGIVPGGLFSQPTNIGEQTGSELTVVPEISLRLGYEPVQRLRLFVGYNFLYWSSVVRPGNQIDHAINQTQQGGNLLVGPAQPAPMFNRSSFYAHGLNLGLAWRY
jgi:hypothetical protein